jgi:hypothetical protein
MSSSFHPWWETPIGSENNDTTIINPFEFAAVYPSYPISHQPSESISCGHVLPLHSLVKYLHPQRHDRDDDDDDVLDDTTNYGTAAVPTTRTSLQVDKRTTNSNNRCCPVCQSTIGYVRHPPPSFHALATSMIPPESHAIRSFTFKYSKIIYEISVVTAASNQGTPSTTGSNETTNIDSNNIMMEKSFNTIQSRLIELFQFVPSTFKIVCQGKVIYPSVSSSPPDKEHISRQLLDLSYALLHPNRNGNTTNGPTTTTTTATSAMTVQKLPRNVLILVLGTIRGDELHDLPVSTIYPNNNMDSSGSSTWIVSALLLLMGLLYETTLSIMQRLTRSLHHVIGSIHHMIRSLYSSSSSSSTASNSLSSSSSSSPALLSNNDVIRSNQHHPSTLRQRR